MNKLAKMFIKNFSYSLYSNVLSFLITTLVILLVPKFVGVKEYGFWQLYLFYTSYIGFMHLGWADGIYLRYGGKEYQKLNKDIFSSQFWLLCAFELIVTLIIYCIVNFLIIDVDKNFILRLTALNCIVVLPKTMLSFILQATNRIKEYSYIIVVEKVTYLILISVTFLVGIKNYRILVLLDVVGKGISLLFSIYYCRDIVFRKVASFSIAIKEAWENIEVGAKLMIANVASMLIIGIVKLAIETTWDIETFGKVSLSMTISNMLMVFISAIGVILFPILRRVKKEKMADIYIIMRTILMIVLFGMLALYYPIKIIISSWLPEYAESLSYIALMFPICIYESKVSMLINTYMKTLRKEKEMLYINIISVIIASILTFITVRIIKNLELTVVSIVIIFAIRCIITEMILSKYLLIRVKKDIVLEFILSSFFIVSSWFIGSWIGFSIYAACYILYLFIKSREISNTKEVIGSLIRS